MSYNPYTILVYLYAFFLASVIFVNIIAVVLRWIVEFATKRMKTTAPVPKLKKLKIRKA